MNVKTSWKGSNQRQEGMALPHPGGGGGGGQCSRGASASTMAWECRYMIFDSTRTGQSEGHSGGPVCKVVKYWLGMPDNCQGMSLICLHDATMQTAQLEPTQSSHMLGGNIWNTGWTGSTKPRQG